MANFSSVVVTMFERGFATGFCGEFASIFTFILMFTQHKCILHSLKTSLNSRKSRLCVRMRLADLKQTRGK